MTTNFSDEQATDECERPDCVRIAATACEVYYEITGGKLSYPTYDTRTILAEANAYRQQLIDEECAALLARAQRAEADRDAALSTLLMLLERVGVAEGDEQ